MKSSEPKSMEEQVREIHVALVGNDLHPEGLVKKVESIKNKVDRHDKYFAIGIGIGTIFCSLLVFWDKFTSLFN